MTSTSRDLDSADAAPPVSRRTLTIGLCASIVAIAFEAIAVATAMPVAAAALHGIGVYAWAFSLFLIGQLFATIAAGRVADRVGPSRPMIAGLLVFAVGLVVAGSAQQMWQLIAGRFIQGLAGGILGVSIYVCIARGFEERQRPRMFSYISTAWVLPSFVGPPVAAWLTHRFGWPWVFFGVLPLLAFAAAMVIPTLVRMARTELREPVEPSTARPAPLWAAGLAAVGAALIQLAGQRLQPLSILVALAGAAALLVSLPRLMPPGFLRFHTGLPAVIAVRGLLAGAFFGAEAFIPLMLVEQRGLALVLAGAVLTIGAVGWTTGSWIQSRPTLALRRDRIITLGSACILLGLLCAASAAFWPAVWVGMVGVGWILGGFGMGMSIASTSLATMSLSAVSEQGRSASSLQFGEALGAGLFVGISGSIFAALHPGGNLPLTFGVVLTAMAAVALVGIAMSLRIGRVANELAR
ncbi:MFS transporter [Microlunatus panaciterrae]|uniref:MFS family permease n=1 Tax=Microlunatus panaciterrae TaxID=400768 RepID=A0ABS2RL99_9ACTN|nr:MFS family permease [Microlunatus panaciterrae]